MPSTLAAVVAMAWLALGACAGLSRPYAVELGVGDGVPVGHVEAIGGDRQALASIKAVFERDFGLPPFPVRLDFYPDARAFEQALIEVGYDAAMARDSARHLRAIGAHRRVLLNDEVLAEASHLSRLVTLAHELVHCAQYELGGGRRGTSEQWLREGLAEWLAYAALERLHGPSLAAVRRVMREQFTGSNRSKAPRLHEMAAFRQWVERAGDRDLAMPAHAFLAVDRLIEAHGVAAVIDYFRRFAAREDPAGNFRAAFGTERELFERDLEAALQIRRD
jgi:hypothetical protein